MLLETYRLRTQKELQNTSDYITQSQRKYFKTALKYWDENPEKFSTHQVNMFGKERNIAGVKVNNTGFEFDFEHLEVFITGIDGYRYKHELVKIK